ncbi:hypothetical protein N7448_005161 [Penicillium atrosanguineum]|uniref:Uncharacterized protein n=1 Tax=Penicillium atrosanguineum TaxID=1132637 RepID=A0A9W9PP15_9EURO|nr:uncharacterized protein N7443_008890 [Penicillium atrosanguineum]KAJ5125846.1 hypothetical protein N7526_008023 [Penicillium atrosanguineum]KAJ5136607.1 hypothetical protein N7448_005161 [Penicillium atrosanguineum]KAJ5292937.1 hypothetical protein N7443_008890 [Penicillium atrosanguineum]KAJ5303025.1 hypothetical protein N7476_009824 [Penicillium atrosanguineum]
MLWMHRFWSKIRGTGPKEEEGSQDQHLLLSKVECMRELLPAAIPGSQNLGEQEMKYVGFGIGGAGNIRRVSIQNGQYFDHPAQSYRRDEPRETG